VALAYSLRPLPRTEELQQSRSFVGYSEVAGGFNALVQEVSIVVKMKAASVCDSEVIDWKQYHRPKMTESDRGTIAGPRA
jgi:hypothetical protein